MLKKIQKIRDGSEKNTQETEIVFSGGFMHKPVSVPPQFKKKKPFFQEKTQSLDLHVDLIKKVDEILTEHKKDHAVHEEFFESIVTQQSRTIPFIPTYIEPRMPLTKKVTISTFTPTRPPNMLFRSEIPQEFHVDLSLGEQSDFRFVHSLEPSTSFSNYQSVAILPESNKIVLDRVLGNVDVSVQKNSMGFLGIKKRTKDEVARLDKQKNNTEITTLKPHHSTHTHETSSAKKKKHQKKTEIEQTKKTPEEQKKELELLKQEAKIKEKMVDEKEKELKRLEIERRKKDKEEKELEKLEEKEMYIPLNPNHLVQELQIKEQEKQMRKELEKQRKDVEEEKLITLEAKQTEKLLKQKQKEMKKQEKRKEKQKRLDEKLLSKEIKKHKQAEKHHTKEPKGLKEKSTKHGFFRKKTDDLVTPERSLSPHPAKTSLVSEPSLSVVSEKHKGTKDEVSFDEDLCKVLLITDNLLAKLPDDVIESFAQSEDFSLYEKVLNKYRIK